MKIDSSEKDSKQRRVLSYLEVQAAADAIVADGGVPTVRGVYDVVQLGSFTTVGKLLNRWKAERPAKQAEKGDRVSQESADSLERDIQRAIDRETAELRAELLSVQSDYESVLEESGKFEESSKDFEVKNIELEKSNTELNAELTKVKKIEGELKEQLKEQRGFIEQQRTELAGALVSQESLREGRRELQAVIRESQAEIKAAESRAAAAEKGEAVSLARQEAQTTAAELLTKQLVEKNQKLKKLEERLEVMQSRFDEAIKEARVQAEVVSQLKEQLHHEHKKNAELCSEIDYLKDTVTVLKQADKKDIKQGA